MITGPLRFWSGFLLHTFLFAGTYSGSFVGFVTDPSESPISGARIDVRHHTTDQHFIAESNEAGAYLVTGLLPGSYSITVQSPNFVPVHDSGLILEIGQTIRVDFRLSITVSPSEITVTAASGVVETESAQRGQLISSHEIQSIPLNGRNYLTLALLAPGVGPSPAGQNPHNINGTRSDHVGYLIDGLANLQRRGNEQVAAPSLETIQEFRIVTNAYAAEYGRMAGVVSVALKSGTNEFHGSLFEFLRNDKLDARGFFDPGTPKLKRNQFGGLIGGPIVGGRTFFLLSSEILVSRAEETRLSRVPTPAERAGVSSAPIRDPFTGALFPANTIPTGRINPVSQNLLAFLPLPNRAGALNYFTTASTPIDNPVTTARLDHRFTPRDHIFGQVVFDLRRAASPFRATNLTGFGSGASGLNQHWGISYNRIVAPSILNQARLAFNRARFTETSVNAGRNTAFDAGIRGVASNSGLTNIVIAGYTPFGDVPALPSDWTDNGFFFADTLSLARGRHAIKAGAEFQRAQYFELFAAYAMGQLAFANAGSGNPFADFLLGLPQQAQRQIGTNKSYLLSSLAGAFVQDDWRVHPRLTLNLGLRYDLNPPPVEKFNRWSNFIPALGRSIASGDPAFPRALLRTHYRNFSPRLGLAWRLDRSARTALRVGFGVFYNYDLQFQTYQALGATAYPFTQLQLLQTSPSRRLQLPDPFSVPGSLNPTALSPNGVAYDNPSPYTSNWNLTLAREIGLTTGLELAYVGSNSIHQSAAINVNQPLRGPLGSTVPFPGLSRVILFDPAANANYHALQINVRRRFAAGLSLRSAFTWSKTIDYLSYGSAARQPQDAHDLRAERGLADFHRGRTFTSDLVYDLPFGLGRRLGAHWTRTVDFLLGHWQIAALLRAYDGLPFTPSQTGNAQAGEPTRPDRVASGAAAAPTIDRWFDLSAFSRVPLSAFRYGNSGRNILTGPSLLAFDASLGKQFSFAETRALIVRAEFFNLPNRANFGLPTTAIDQPAAGAIPSADSGRQIQFGLKLLF